ncbi:MAG: flagellar type III secretion system pore protein FliP [Lysobacteraceae bacterium]
MPTFAFLRFLPRPALRSLRWIALVAALLLPACALAAPGGGPQPTGLPEVTVANVGGEDVSVSLAVLLSMTALTLLPSLLLACTAFTRIIVVMALLRMALGTGQTPSNQILVGLALFLTMMVMMPVAEQAWANGLAPYLNGDLPFQAAWTASTEPFRAFMLAQIRDTDLLTFANLSGHTQGFASPQDIPFGVLVASFITSELKTAFEIGFLIFVPFVVIDLVVASVLMSMGMMMMSPMLVSAPFKILLFVLVDGWVLVVGTLAGSFNPAMVGAAATAAGAGA